jgi:DNA-binding SARP family transcriptional activator
MTQISNSHKAEQHVSFTVTTLGHFDVFKEGHSLVMASSSSKKIWELYKFMLTFRDRSFTPESLSDQLWVSEEYNDPRGTLRRQMHRLRKQLDEEETTDELKTILFTNGYYKWNDKVTLHLDIEEFSSLVSQGDTLRTDKPDQAISAYLAAIDLYKGDYLPESYEQHWVFPVRTQYRRMFLSTILNAVTILNSMQQYDKVIKLCEKGIQIDIYEEIFHLHLMETLLTIGEQRQALEHYGYITSFYDKEMGLKPSLEMRDLYKRLLKLNQPISSNESLVDALEPDIPFDQAFYCEPEAFKSIYELERRRNERSSIVSSIGVLTMVVPASYTSAQKEIRMRQMKEHLLLNLRKGDTFTRWNDKQIVVLLSGIDMQVTEKVLNRMIADNKHFETVQIHQLKELPSFIPKTL